ncbi:MAG: hypothetical protein AAF718_09570 [Pseudomonadota bacterium]
MTSPIRFKERQVQMNNRHFSNFLEFALQTADRLSKSAFEDGELTRMKCLRKRGEFWPGRGLQIEDDFTDPDQLKLWSRVSFETAQSVFLREVGAQTNSYWQAQMIYLAYAAGYLFLDAYRELSGDGRWFPDLRSSEEFRRVNAPGS